MDSSAVSRAIVRSVPAFKSLSDTACDALVGCLRVRRLLGGEVLFRQGDAGESLVIVRDGSLAVRARRPDGMDAEVNRAGAGEILGELSCVDPAPRSATVVALVPTTVCELSVGGLVALRGTAPGAYAVVMGAVIRDIHRRAREVDAQIQALLAARDGTAPAPASGVGGVGRGALPGATHSGRPSSVGTPAAEQGGLRRLLDRLRGMA